MPYETDFPNAASPGVVPPSAQPPRSAQAVTLTLLRVVVGVIMVVHGYQKLMDLETWQGNLANMGMPLPALFGLLAVAAEFLGGLGLIAGLLTRIAAFGVFCTMTVAIYLVHLPHGFLQSNNGFEYPLALASAALFFIANGAGPISVDAWLGRFMRERRAPAAPPPTYERPVVTPPPAHARR